MYESVVKDLPSQFVACCLLNSQTQCLSNLFSRVCCFLNYIILLYAFLYGILFPCHMLSNIVFCFVHILISSQRNKLQNNKPLWNLVTIKRQYHSSFLSFQSSTRVFVIIQKLTNIISTFIYDLFGNIQVIIQSKLLNAFFARAEKRVKKCKLRRRD